MKTMKLQPIKKKVSYGGAMIGWREVYAVLKVMLSQGGRRWTIGPESEAFEKELAQTAGMKHAVVVNSGSSALLVAISSLNLPKGSKVIIPALNFPTAYSSLLQAGLIPVVVDCGLDLLLDFEEVEKALELHPDIKAVVAVHIAGNCVDLPKLREIVGDRIIISDNCDGFGSTLNGKFIDTYADVSCVSFHAAHIITTGEGGAVLTDNAEIASRARKKREWGRESGSDKLTQIKGLPGDYRERYVYTEIGYNVKPLELQCAMGRVQLKKLPFFVKKRQENYEKLFEGIIGQTKLMPVLGQEGNCWFGFPFICVTADRGAVMDYLESLNIETRTIFSGNILKHPAYAGTGIQIGKLNVSNLIMERGVFISNHPSLTDKQINFVIEALQSI